MYTLQKAAAMLGISERTARSWLQECGIEGKLIATDRRRLYITHTDMNILIDYLDQKITKSIRNKRKQKVNNTEGLTKGEDKDAAFQIEDRLYSLGEVTLLLDISLKTLRNWVSQHNIEVKIIISDKKRAYIARDDILLLADVHKRKIVKNGYTDVNTQQEVHNVVPKNSDELCSIADVSAILNVTQDCVYRWIRRYNIGKTTKITDRRRTYIKYGDVLMLADLGKRKIVDNSPIPVNILEELKEIKSMLEKHASEIEDIKHDLRLLAKRSIHIG